MTNPYSVPLEDLDAVHVSGEELVEQQQPALRWAAGGGGALLPFGDGAGGDVDGD